MKYYYNASGSFNNFNPHINNKDFHDPYSLSSTKTNPMIHSFNN